MKRLFAIIASAALIVAACVEEPQTIGVSSVTLSPTTLELTEGETARITVTVLPEDASNEDVTWSSSDASVASVEDGVIMANAVGNATVIATASGKSATCKVTVSASSAEHKYVDLGLPSGLKWATCNVGASASEDFGDYFAWGATEPYYEKGYAQSVNPVWKAGKNNGGYNWTNCPFRTSGSLDEAVKFSKYNTSPLCGPIDNKTVLDIEDDAAHVNWGSSWRIPTLAEWKELITNCTWTRTSQNGVSGMRVTGPSGKSIFLPSAGRRYNKYLDHTGSYGRYWSSSLCSRVSHAYELLFHYDNDVDWHESPRREGRSVRPVSE